MPEQTTLQVKAPSKSNGYLGLLLPFHLFLMRFMCEKAAKRQRHPFGVGRALSAELVIGEARDEAALLRSRVRH